MAESFSVGEIAIWARTLGSKEFSGTTGRSIRRGSEVTVVGPLMLRAVRLKTGVDFLNTYEIVDEDGYSWAAFPEWLKKRPPKQDWKTLCNLTDLPSEVTCA